MQKQGTKDDESIIEEFYTLNYIRSTTFQLIRWHAIDNCGMEYFVFSRLGQLNSLLAVPKAALAAEFQE